MMKKFCKYVFEVFCLGTLLVAMSSCASFSLTSQADRSASELSEEEEAQLVRQMNDVLWQADSSLRNGQAHLEEKRFTEARDEFERARLSLDQASERSLNHINRVSIQGGRTVLLSSQISGIMIRQRQVERDVEHWLEILEKEQREAEKVEIMRQKSRTQLQPINPPIRIARATAFVSPSREGSWTYGAGNTIEDSIQRNIIELHRKGDIFRQALLRANSLFPRVTSILTDEGVPGFLAYVALLESGYQPEARSRFGQAGLWQFSPSLARQYGLTVNASYDERLHLDASTRAFARYMLRLYRQYGNWIQAIDAFSPKPNYLARVIAANRIANEPRQYGFYLELHNMAGRHDLLREGSQLQSFSEPEFCGPPAYR